MPWCLTVFVRCRDDQVTYILEGRRALNIIIIVSMTRL